MLVMSDIEDPFVPLGSDGLFVDPYKSKYVPTQQGVVVEVNANLLGPSSLLSSRIYLNSSHMAKVQSLLSYRRLSLQYHL